MTTIKPLYDRLVVRRIEEKTMSEGGIIIPDSAKQKSSEGDVLAVGSGKVLEDGRVRPLEVKQGDLVLFSKYAGTEVKLDGQDLIILKEDDVLGVVS
jgi:chaperonin GroES